MKTVNPRKCAMCGHPPSDHTKTGREGPAPAEGDCASRCSTFVPIRGQKKSKDHVTHFDGKIRLGKREAFIHVTVTLTLPPDLTPSEERALERFDLATALTTMRARPSGRLDAILASVKAKLDTGERGRLPVEILKASRCLCSLQSDLWRSMVRSRS